MKPVKLTILFIALTSVIISSPLQAMLPRASRTFGNITRDTARNTLQSRSFSRTMYNRPSALHANHTRIIARAMLPQTSQTRTYSNTIKSNPPSKALFSRAPHISNTYMFVPKRKWHPTNNYSLYENFKNKCAIWKKYTNKIGLAAAVTNTIALGWCYLSNNLNKTEIILQKIKQAPKTITYKDILHLFSEKQLEKLLKDEEMAPIITLAATRNFNALAKRNKRYVNCSGRSVLDLIIEHNPDAAKQFTPPAAQNFNTLAKDWFGRSQLHSITLNNPDAAKKFTDLAVQNFNTLAKDLFGCFVLENIMKHYPEAAQIFTPLAAQIFNTLVNTYYGSLLLENIMKNYPEAAQIFTPFVAKSIQEIQAFLLKTLIEKNPHSSEIKEALENSILNENKASNSFNAIKKVLKYFTNILTSTEQYRHENVTIKKLLYKKYFTDNPSLTPTEQHILANLKEFPSLAYYLSSPPFSDLHTQIIEKERELKNQGYCTFFHGQRWEYQLAEQWFRQLWELSKQKPIQDYIFPHLKQEAIQADLDNEQKKREQILKHGTYRKCLICPETSAYPKVLFTNCPLFGNSTSQGSSSAHYFADNQNAGSVQVSLKDVFHLHGYSSYYEKYKSELEKLKREHKNVSEYGNMLLIAIPQDKLKDCVYLCEVDADKQSINIPNIGKTDNIETIVDTLHTNPEKLEDSDQLIFCMPMTGDLTLNPYGGLKIFSFNAADKEKFAAFNKKSDALFQKIKQDVEQDRNSTMN